VKEKRIETEAGSGELGFLVFVDPRGELLLCTLMLCGESTWDTTDGRFSGRRPENKFREQAPFSLTFTQSS